MRNQSEADLRTELIHKALNTNTKYYDISRSDHDMQYVYSLPPSGELEMGDDIPRDEIPRSVPPLTDSSTSSMSVTQNAAVADNSGEVERQRQLAQYEIQQP